MSSVKPKNDEDLYEHVTRGLLDWNNLITSAEFNKAPTLKSPTITALETGGITRESGGNKGDMTLELSPHLLVFRYSQYFKTFIRSSRKYERNS